MKRISIFILVLLMIFTQVNPAFGGQWVNADTSNNKVWVDTSHWENHRYQVWVDTSHWEYRPYNAWVSSGYWNYWSYWGNWYWVQDYVGNQYLTKGGDYKIGIISNGAWWYYNIPGSFYSNISNAGDERVVKYRYDCNRNVNYANKQAIGYRPQKDIAIYMDFSWDSGAPRHINRPWHLWLSSESSAASCLKGYSYGYDRQDLIRGATWIDTSHWETWWGWFWITSGYSEWRDNWVWVTSGYWDEAHGQVSVSKSPTYVFTSFHKTEEGEPSHLDLNLSWNMNKEVTGIRVYHELVRYRNKGTITVDGKKESVVGMGTKNGQATYRMEYPKPGTGDSKLYIQFTFVNNTGVRMWANVPVNGFDSTLQDKTAVPVWFKSLLDRENVSF